MHLMATVLVVYMQCKWLCFVDLSTKKMSSISGEFEPVNPPPFKYGPVGQHLGALVS